jgi:hypothetical protein
MRRTLPLWRCRGSPALSLLSDGFDRVSQIAGVVG